MFAGELKGFHENFADCFLRGDSRDNFYRYMSGEHTRLETFVRLSGLRWSIEQCFAETKTELGMDHYTTRCASFRAGIIIS